MLWCSVRLEKATLSRARSQSPKSATAGPAHTIGATRGQHRALLGFSTERLRDSLAMLNPRIEWLVIERKMNRNGKNLHRAEAQSEIPSHGSSLTQWWPKKTQGVLAWTKQSWGKNRIRWPDSLPTSTVQPNLPMPRLCENQRALYTAARPFHASRKGRKGALPLEELHYEAEIEEGIQHKEEAVPESNPGIESSEVQFVVSADALDH